MDILYLPLAAVLLLWGTAIYIQGTTTADRGVRVVLFGLAVGMTTAGLAVLRMV